MKEYVPSPVDTQDVELPESLIALVEKIARNVHDVWAQSRIAEGWTYGPARNDALKQTPCLVDYDDLPEEEKAYDRNTAVGTLKLIVKLGYKVTFTENQD
ncbi:MAG: Ryanodine receptor Ryr [Paludibacteraceae bacterium]|nr:Ryanodine receptor Ryr [Paludibacteraceae bacterium]MCQ2343845.1 Ryanodine receptor Ryr [Paludibacteraceae bacterium]